MLLQRGHLAAIGLCCVLNGVATAGEEFSKLEDSEFYSDLTYNPAKGEFSGNQTMIIPSTEGEKVLWRVADGQFNAPLLLDAVKQRDVLRVTVPNAGEWTLRIRGTALDAISSRGVKLKLSQTLVKQ